MSIIERMFTAKPECERLHQAVLSVLLVEPILVERLAGVHLPLPEVIWEPDDGAFDLAVVSKGQPRVLIELKLDDELTRKRIERQFMQAHHTDGERAVYLLLGLSGISRGLHWPDWSEVYVENKPRAYSSSELRVMLEECLIGVKDPVWRELADSYAKVLLLLEKRTKAFSGKDFALYKDRDYLGYFDALRRAANIPQARVQLVPASKRPAFVCLAWSRAALDLGAVYLQFEYGKLYLKLAAHGYTREQRRVLRRSVRTAANALATKFTDLKFVAGANSSGKSMTIGYLAGVTLTPDPTSSTLLSQVKAAEQFVRALADGWCQAVSS